MYVGKLSTLNNIIVEPKKDNIMRTYNPNRAARRADDGVTKPTKIKVLTSIGSMMETFENITRNHNTGINIKGHVFDVIEDVSNNYYSYQLAIIKAGSKIKADFACDSGMYAMTEMENGMLHKILIPFTELYKINFGIFDARNKGYTPVVEVKRPESNDRDDY